MIDAMTGEESELSVKSLNTIRDEILNILLPAISIFAILPLLASLSRIPNLGWQYIMYFHVMTYVVICTASIFRHKIRYSYKALLLVSISFLIGCLGIWNLGLIGSGVIFMVFALILSAFAEYHGLARG